LIVRFSIRLCYASRKAAEEDRRINIVSLFILDFSRYNKEMCFNICLLSFTTKVPACKQNEAKAIAHGQKRE
jgi:hypothetical protein